MKDKNVRVGDKIRVETGLYEGEIGTVCSFSIGRVVYQRADGGVSRALFGDVRVLAEGEYEALILMGEPPHPLWGNWNEMEPIAKRARELSAMWKKLGKNHGGFPDPTPPKK